MTMGLKAEVGTLPYSISGIMAGLIAVLGVIALVVVTMRLQRAPSSFVSAGEPLPVGLYDSEKECRADAEQQHAVHRFEGA